MEPAFRNLTLDDKKIFDKYAEAMQKYHGCEYCFPLLFVENANGETQICDLSDMAIIRTKWRRERVYYPPLLKDIAAFPKAIQFIEQQSNLEGVRLDIRMLSAPLHELLDTNKYTVTKSREFTDYVYDAKDLIQLPGKKFHAKRNYITRFYKTYDYTFRTYDEVSDREAILKLLKKWDTNTEHKKWAIEEELIVRAIDAHKALDLKIAVLYVKTELAAFSVSSIRNAEIAYTIFEKADTDYVGAYQVINQRTAEMFFGNVLYVNRQCDMDVEGLRKAKMSYNPTSLIDKYHVQHRQLT